MPEGYNVKILPYFFNTLDLEKNADLLVKRASDEITESKSKDVWFSIFVKIYAFPNRFCSLRILLCKFASKLHVESGIP